MNAASEIHQNKGESMIVKDIINKVAKILEIKEILEDEYLDSVGQTISVTEGEVTADVLITSAWLFERNKTLDKVFNLVNLVFGELGSDYMNIITEKTCTSDADGKIDYVDLPCFMRATKVLDADEHKVRFEMFDNYLKMENSGTYKVFYKIKPKFAQIEDTNYDDQYFDFDVVVYGVCAFYCLTCALFDEHEIYMNIYKEKLNKISNVRNFYLPSRRWQ